MIRERRGRGIDFKHRFKSSRWAEDRALTAFRRAGMVAVRVGISGVSADNRVSTTAGQTKVPDLIVIRRSPLTRLQHRRLAETNFDLRKASAELLERAGGLAFVLAEAVCAVEIEFSPYLAAEMTQRHWAVRTEAALMRRQLKHAKPPTAPNIFVKEEDMAPLLAWQRKAGIPIVVLHMFNQEAFAISLRFLSRAWRKLKRQRPAARINSQLRTGVFFKLQGFDRSDAQGAAEKKWVLVTSPAASVFAGPVTGVRVQAQLGVSGSKKYVAHVLFRGGKLTLSKEFLNYLNGLARATPGARPSTARAIGSLIGVSG